MAASLQSCAMRVPSAVMPFESNILLNPLHPDYSQIQVLMTLPFAFDRRARKS
jgi:RES domain-containing protein